MYGKNLLFTLQGINISHLGKRKIIFKMPFLGDMLVPWRVLVSRPLCIKLMQTSHQKKLTWISLNCWKPRHCHCPLQGPGSDGVRISALSVRLPGHVKSYMDVSENNGTPKSSNFNRVFHCKPSILG